MDQSVKLGKLIREDSLLQFGAHLAHATSKLSPHLLGLALFEVLNSNVACPGDYIAQLLKYKINPNVIYSNKERLPEFEGKTALMVACQKCSFEVVSLMLACKQVKVGLSDSDGENELFYALRNQSEEETYHIIRALLVENQKLANSVNHEGLSLLFASLETKSLRIIELLLKNSADPNYKCKATGNTAFHKALMASSLSTEKKKDLILLLINYNADPTILNNQDKSSFEVAKQVGFSLDWLDEVNNDDSSLDDVMFFHRKEESVAKSEQFTNDGGVSFSVMSEDTDQPLRVECLSQEIINFARLSEKRHQQSWKDIEQLYEYLDRLGQEMNLKIDMIGSYAYGLWTPSSDIDIAYTNINSGYIDIEEKLAEIYEILREKTKEFGVKQIYFNRNFNGNSFPNIKIDLEPRLHQRKIDITIFQKKNNGIKYVQFVAGHLNQNYLIKPVFYLLQRLLKTFNLANPSKHGVKTYTIFLMILLSYQNLGAQTVGELLINTVYYYTYYFPYEQSLGPGGQLVCRMNIQDPLNKLNNTGGKRTDVNAIRGMFRAIDYGLRLATNKAILEYLFSLHNIFEA